jgi:hypothetical protein
MAELKDPKRLFESDEAPPELRNWLDRARHDALPAEGVSELVRQVEELASQPALPSAGRVTAKNAFNAKALLLAAGIGVGAASLWLLLPRRAESPALKPPATLPSAPMVRTLPSPRLRAVDEDEVEAPKDAPAPAPSASVRAKHAASSPRASAQPAAPDEAQLLRSARAALPSTPARALELTVEHERLYRSGMLVQEREAIAIEALMRLGRRSEATARADRFLARFPASPYRARIESARGANAP